MTAQNLISKVVPPLKLSDTGQKALDWMGSFHVQHLPITNEKKYIGMIAEYDILDGNYAEKSFAEYDWSEKQIFVHYNTHIYDVVKIINDNHLSLIAVLGEDDEYLGVISLQNLLDYFAEINAMKERGGIIILEMNVNDYVLSEIAQIVESNGAKILSMYVTTNTINTKIDVTIKINKMELRRIIATFERYEYTIKASYQENSFIPDVQERYDSFMNYLNV